MFPSFTADTAWALGNALRNRLYPLSGPVVISIASTNNSHLLFHTVTHGGTFPDNDKWVTRKRAAVERWGCSTWLLQNKFGGDEGAWRSKFGSKEPYPFFTSSFCIMGVRLSKTRWFEVDEID